MIKNYVQRETVKSENYGIVRDSSLPLEKRVAAAEKILDAYYDRSAEAVLLSYGHPSPEKYYAMLLRNGKFDDETSRDVYVELVKKYGKQRGIERGKTYFIKR